MFLDLHGRGEGYVNVHPRFRAIFTSNPMEYAGVYRTQDALLDRMITLPLDHYDRETEIAIAASKSGLDMARASRVVDLVRLCRSEGDDPHHPTLRASIAIARVLAARGGEASLRNPSSLVEPGHPQPDVEAGKSEGAISSAFVDFLLRRLESVGDADAAHIRGR